MSRILLFNKPYGVVCQFRRDGLHPTLADYIAVPDLYPAGRLDADSEGLLLLTDDGMLQHRITDPQHKLAKIYWVQVEGEPSEMALAQLRNGVTLSDFVTLPAKARLMEEPANLWQRTPPIRQRKNKPTNQLAGIDYSRGQESSGAPYDRCRGLSYFALDSLPDWRVDVGWVGVGHLA